MSRFILLCSLILVAALGAGCFHMQESLHSARSSFPIKHFYRPSYETIGAMYKTDPNFAIELLERLSRRNPGQLAYKLTLADMYADAGRINDAIRLWFEILHRSGDREVVGGKTLQVYFIPIIPHQEEGKRPYGQKIDKPLAYDHIASIYLQNGFFEEAGEYFSKAAEYAVNPDRKAQLYHRAGQAIGSKKVEFIVSEKDGLPYDKSGESPVLADPMRYRRKEMAFYVMALTLHVSDESLREKIEESLSLVKMEIMNYERQRFMQGEASSGSRLILSQNPKEG